MVRRIETIVSVRKLGKTFAGPLEVRTVETTKRQERERIHDTFRHEDAVFTTNIREEATRVYQLQGIRPWTFFLGRRVLPFFEQISSFHRGDVDPEIPQPDVLRTVTETKHLRAQIRHSGQGRDRRKVLIVRGF